TYSNWELIAINDGSVDATYEILKSFAQNDHRIVLINKENGGASQARNIGLLKATGEFIAFIDDDDYVDPDFLNKLVDAITEFNADIAMCNIIQNDGSLEYNWEKIEFFKGNEQIFDEYAREGICNRIWNKLYRREVVEGIYFANDRPIGEDSLWTPQVMERASSLVRIPKGYYQYIIRQNSLMHGGRPDNMARLEFLANAFLGMLIILKFANDQEGRSKKLKVSISLCIQAVTRNLDLHYFETDRIIQSFIKQNPDIYDYCSTNAEKL
ncbi:TPA: glycosyltransferase, partial [Streptococcus suis]|nr:glycosyltransferase [Streptococcus suis]